MANTVKIKNSGTPNTVPMSLEYGELAINYADGKVFYKNSSNQITELSSGVSATFNIDGGNSSTVYDVDPLDGGGA